MIWPILPALMGRQHHAKISASLLGLILGFRIFVIRDGNAGQRFYRTANFACLDHQHWLLSSGNRFLF